MRQSVGMHRSSSRGSVGNRGTRHGAGVERRHAAAGAQLGCLAEWLASWGARRDDAGAGLLGPLKTSARRLCLTGRRNASLATTESNHAS